MERNMHIAYSMSLNSTCISRQVGAVIVKDGDIIGAGWNDTGNDRVGCIYRFRSDISRTDNTSFPIISERDYDEFQKIILKDKDRIDQSFCYKDEYGEFKKRKKDFLEDMPLEIEKFIEEIETRSLQHCRALHAEENAILQISRLGGVAVYGSTIYTTTFPCELCAKKIRSVGIKRVVYCEPYPRSVSKDVFFKEGTSKIEIKPFECVKSPSFFRLFKPLFDIKDLQDLEIMSIKEA